MQRVIIASKNPVKIQAAKNGFENMFPNQKFEFISVSVPSGVAHQPSSSDEAFLGAKNRADNSSNEVKNADFYVGIEGGIERVVNVVNNEMEAFAWVVIKSAGKYGKAKTGTFFLPKPVVELIKEGKELGEANDIVFQCNNSKQTDGAVGLLTKGLINRKKIYTEAVILALIPFKHVELY